MVVGGQTPLTASKGCHAVERPSCSCSDPLPSHMLPKPGENDTRPSLPEVGSSSVWWLVLDTNAERTGHFMLMKIIRAHLPQESWYEKAREAGTSGAYILSLSIDQGLFSIRPGFEQVFTKETKTN